MKTEIFQSYESFLSRPDKSVNGVSPEFAAAHPNWEQENISNQSCYDCSRCSDCSDCSGCSDCSDCSRCSDCSDCSGCSRCYDCSRCSRCSGIPEGSKHACFIGVYRYICSPRIHSNGEQWVQMGCYLRTREEWESDPWNNPSEFPDDGSPASQARQLALSLAFQWLDANSTTKSP